MSARAIALYGEARPVAPRRALVVGALSAMRDGLGLRWLHLGATELLRGIMFVVRDDNWGTIVMEDVQTTNLPVTDGLHERIAARAVMPGGWLDCTVEIRMTAHMISLTGLAKARGAMRTNRTGFTILYGEGCAGQPVTVEHEDGRTVCDRFPEHISPHQPFFDIRALRHEPAPGLSVRTVMEGDTFEMEDQRNWSDASFKVYCRPLAAPFPYSIADGETVRQTVRITLNAPAALTRPTAPAPVRITLGGVTDRHLPRLGIGGSPQDWIVSESEAALLQPLRPKVLMAEADLGADTPDLAPLRAAAERIGGDVALLARLPVSDALSALKRLAATRPEFDVLALADADATSLEAARRLFPSVRIGVGTAAFFAEFNRAPPPSGADFVFWTVNPTVHAMDDASVMETLRALPEQAATAQILAPGLPLWCGPVTFRKRFNPNATRPETGDQPLDPRQRGLFGAAFTLGQIAAWAAAGLETLILYQPFGPCGLASQPECAPFPLYHLWRALGRADLRATRNTAPERIVALAMEDALWLGNLSSEVVAVEIAGSHDARLLIMDADSLAQGRIAGGLLDHATPVSNGAISIGPFAIARVTLGSGIDSGVSHHAARRC
jgi:hypothetical protein